ncbi:MAG: sortase, partial [Patescibacteria group bacterium]
RIYPGINWAISGILARFPVLASETEKTTLTPLGDTVPEMPANSVSRKAPTQIAFPALDLTLGVAEATITGDSWTLFETQASWLATSAEPGKGNVILYAHNRKGLFGSLNKLQVGAQIDVSHEGREYHYIVSEKQSVSPRDVNAILAGGDRLTLYTCDGTFDQKRLVVVALPRI